MDIIVEIITKIPLLILSECSILGRDQRPIPYDGLAVCIHHSMTNVEQCSIHQCCPPMLSTKPCAQVTFQPTGKILAILLYYLRADLHWQGNAHDLYELQYLFNLANAKT
jgi:hypothetical protein